MKKLLLLIALALTVCSTAMAETLTAESAVGTIGTLDGREAMVVDLGGSIGKVAVATMNVGATNVNDYGTPFSAEDALDSDKNGLTDGWYVPSKDELTALKSLLAWKSDNSAVYYKNHSDLQFPLRPSGQSYYGDYITSTTSVSGTYTDYAYLYIAYEYNKGEGSGTRSISMSEGHNQSDFAIRPFHKLPTKNQFLFYTSSDSNVVTPANDNFNVSIVNNTYDNGQGVIIFDGELTSIGDYAFSGKSTLTSVTFPASLKYIGVSAFHETEITSVTIPASVTSIGNFAFNGCSKLSSLTFTEGSQLETIGGNAFNGTSISGELTLPASLNTIGGYAFNATKITAVTIPASLKSIGKYAFNNCSGLKTLTFAEGLQLETIEDHAFKQAGITGELTLPASLKTIGESAFKDCSGLTKLTFAEGSQLKNIGSLAFAGTAISGELTLPASVTTIEGNAFSNCSLTKVYMSSEDLSGSHSLIFNAGAVIIVPAELYELYKNHFGYNNKVEVEPLSDLQEYTIAQIKAAMKTANTISDTDKTTIAGYISTIEDATTFDGTLEAYYAALALIDQQKAFEEKVKGVFNTLGTKQDGPAIEIVGEDGQTFQLYKIKNVKFIKVSTEK